MKTLQVGVCALLLGLAVPWTQVRANDAPLEIKPVAGIDENLFLMRALEVTYERWPRNTADSAYLQSWLAQTRVRTSRLRAAIKTNNLDPNIGTLYDDCLRLLSTYEDYLANLGAIDRNAVRREQEDSTKVAHTAFRVSFNTASEASRQGALAGDSAGVGILAGIISGALEDYQRRNARDEARRAALEAEARRVQAVWTETRSHAEALAEKLTRLRGWKPGEAGFDNFTSQQMRDYLARRPRDPFVKVANARMVVKGETAADVLSDSRACLEAARLVPDGRAYDVYRVEFVAAAADVAVTAVSLELDKFNYSSGPAKSAPEAVRVCKTLLALDPADSTGTGNMLLARALACGGRYSEAIGAANAAANRWRHDAYFCYRYARLMSLTNQVNLAGDWLREAYRNGYKDVKHVKQDPDLSNFRTGKPDRFKELTTLKTYFKIDFGVFNDDVIITNASPFELTNVRVEMYVRKGGRTWTPTLTVASLKPGARHKFEDVFSIPGDSYDEARATLYSDQGVD